jgi:pentatricopeptide repeat protein
VGWALGDLTIFLREQGKLAEAESTAREALAIARKQSGSNPAAVTTFLRQLAWVLYGQGKPAEAENISREELAIRRKVFGNEHPEVAATLQCLATFLGDQGKTAEAEITIREALTIREKKLPDDWQTFNARSLLGDTLLRQKKYAEAEPFLLSGYEGLKQREDRIPAVDLLRLKESLQRIVQLYEAVGQPEKAAEWNKTLAEADGILLAEVSSRVRGSGADPEAWLQRAWIETDLNAWKAAIQDYDKAIALSKDESAAKRMTVGEVCVQFAWRAERAAQPEFAERVARQAVVLFRQLGQEDQKDSRVGLGLAGALSRLSFLLRAGRLPEAEATAREALAIRKKLQGNEHANVAESLHLLAWNLNLQGKHTEAEALSRQEVAMWRKLSGNDDPNVAGALGDLTVFLRDQEKLPEAETTIRESLAIRRKRLGDTHPDTANSFSLLVGLLCTQGKLAQAEAVWREELAIRRKLQGSDPLDVAAALIGLSLVLREEGSLPEAVATAREALAIRKKLLGNEHAEVAVSLHVLAWNLSQEGKLIEAEALSRDELAMRRKLSGNDDPDVAWTLRDLTFFLRDQGKLAEAETAIRESLAIRRKRLGDTHPDTVNSFSLLICLLCTQGKLAEAKSMFQEARERGGAQELNEVAWLLATSPDPNLRDGTNAVVFAEKAVAATSRTNASYLDTLAAAHAEEGQFGTAVSVQQEAIALLQTEQEKKDYASRLKLYENHSPYRDHGLLAELVSARLREGKFAEAEGLAHECLAQREREIPDDWRTFNARSMLGGALLGQKKHADAEPFLLSGYEGMKRREVSIPAQGKVRLGEALQRLVQLYGATGRPDQAAEWKKKLKLLDNQETAAAPEEPTK